MKLQKEYDLIYAFFKKTTESFDSLEWNGKTLKVYLKGRVIEKYSLKDLKELISEL